jgi:hypothetical protein
MFIQSQPELRNKFVETKHLAITRMPVPDDPAFRVLGVVTANYKLFTPHELCVEYDKIGRPIETMGALGKGEKFFFSTKLPSFDIHGDMVDSYLLTVSDYNGGTSLRVYIEPVRVVCQNTLAMGISRAGTVIRLMHNDDIEINYRVALTTLYDNAIQELATLRDSYRLFGQTKISDAIQDELLKHIYPDPELPEHSIISTIETSRMRSYAFWKNRVEESREAVLDLYSGVQMGYTDTPALRGTVWGLFNAVAEYENYRRAKSDESRGADVLFGLRASTIQNAYSVLNSYVKQQ